MLRALFWSITINYSLDFLIDWYRTRFRTSPFSKKLLALLCSFDNLNEFGFVGLHFYTILILSEPDFGGSVKENENSTRHFSFFAFIFPVHSTIARKVGSRFRREDYTVVHCSTSIPHDSLYRWPVYWKMRRPVSRDILSCSCNMMPFALR